MMIEYLYYLLCIRYVFTIWLFNSSPWFFDGPNRNRWFTYWKWWIFTVSIAIFQAEESLAKLEDVAQWCAVTQGGQAEARRPSKAPWQPRHLTIWLWHSQFANWKDPPFFIGKPSISIRAIYIYIYIIYHGELLNNQRVTETGPVTMVVKLLI